MIIGGVPEHFNYPWQVLVGEKQLLIENKPLQWHNFPGGTGAMVEALEKDEIDAALLLTEGAVSAISTGKDLRIICPFVTTPLIWGIHVPFNSDIETIEQIQHRTIAISRYTSGSHLMSYVDANERGWPTEQLQFEVVGNLEGARESFKRGSSEVFLWEKITTKPYVDSGEFRRVGERPTPWPCFVLVAKKAYINQHEEALQHLLDKLFITIASCEKDPQLLAKIADMYQLKEEDVHTWKKDTQWAASTKIPQNELDVVSDYLLKLKLIDQKLPAHDLCSSFVELV